MPPANNPRLNPEMRSLYLEMMEHVTALADGHRQLARECLGARDAARLRLLSVLAEDGMEGSAPREVAARMRVSAAAMSRQCRDLRGLGWIEEGDFRGDARCKSLWLTEAGRAAQLRMAEALDRDIQYLAGIARQRALGDLRYHADQMRRQQETCAAYRKRGPRRKPTSVFL